jgi:lambda repressor-like predicted transcriptional regulator
MNLYKLHSKPKTLDHHDQAFEKVPELVWQKYKGKPAELKKREKVLARDPKTAFYYAAYVLKKPWPAGEAAIAKDAGWAYEYADYVLKKPFPAGEAAIAKDTEGYAYLYAREVLKGRWPRGEAAIAKDPVWARPYAYYVLKLSETEAKKWGQK